MAKTTIEALQTLFQTLCASSEAYGIDEEIDIAAMEVQHALDELAALRAWRDRAVSLLRVLAEAEDVAKDEWGDCRLCDYQPHMIPAELGHEATCPIVKARALLAESEASK